MPQPVLKGNELIQSKPRSTKGRAVLAARLAQEKQGRDLLILDISILETPPADFFVIITVDSDSQMRAVGDSIVTTMKQMGFGAPRLEGKGTSSWLILDFFDIVVHIMLTSARDFYKLERLWSDAKAYTLTEAGNISAAKLPPRKASLV